MKKLLGLVLLLVCANGCFIEEGRGGHLHCLGCGHVQVKGIWR